MCIILADDHEFEHSLTCQVTSGQVRSATVAATAAAAAPFARSYATANVSGGHLNPAVTISTVMTGHTSGSRAIFYVTAQVVGAILAAVMHVRSSYGVSDCIFSHD
jgi:glycerol uptake facilitator-like aquaporin